MTSLHDLCLAIQSDPHAAAPLRAACALPRTAADRQPLPDAHEGAAFDSAWDVLLTEIDTHRATPPRAGA